MKVAFFDIDGTLSAPVYLDNAEFVIGFDLDGWAKYCAREKEKTYMYCPVVQEVVDFARILKSKGYSLHVLSVSTGENENKAKRQFIKDNHLDEIFDSYIFVETDDSKLDVMESYANEHNLPFSHCMLVEDRFDTVLKAHVKGFRGVHISNIFTNTVNI